MSYLTFFEAHVQKFRIGLNGQTSGLCPFHEDKNPSLSIDNNEGLWKCHGCGKSGNANQFAHLLGVVPPTNGHNNGLREVNQYTYDDVNGRPHMQVRRYFPKTFRQFRFESGEWKSGLNGFKPILYHLPEVLKANVVFIAEGEKDCETLKNWGLIATCNSMGAGKWRDEFSDVLAGKSIIILPDDDEPGRTHANSVAKSLWGKAKRVKIVYLPDAKDVSAWVEKGGTYEQLMELAEGTPWLDTPPQNIVVGSHSKPTENTWPVLAPDAFYGLAGDIVRTIEPYSEADPVAILANILTAFGNIVGNGPHFQVEHTKHPARLFISLVGETAKGRKGTSWSTPKYLFKCVDPQWADARITGGLSSGEGLIFNVRDEIIEKQPIKEHGRVVEYQDVITDHGVADKRLLLVEEELASVLKVMVREGNTLSAILRQAWDSGDLRPLTKNNPIKATGAHVSLIGHITKTELIRHLTETEKANGFANRFIWLLVRRSKCISNPKKVPDELLAPLLQRLEMTISNAKNIGLVERDEEAEEVWAEVYPALSEGHVGMFGAVTGRAEAQTTRKALVYALLDNSSQIKLPHLKAALALWDYSEASAKFIFGDQTGDSTADKILEALKVKNVMTDNDIYEFFGKNKSANERARALNYLQRIGRARSEVQSDTGGRPKTIWMAT